MGRYRRGRTRAEYDDEGNPHMQAEYEYDIAPETWMALPEACVGSDDVFADAPRGPIPPSHLLELPRLPTPSQSLRDTSGPAPLRFPEEQVRRWSEQYASYARRQGTPHSMRLWRECFYQALQALARQATRQPDDARCTSLHWKLFNGEYLVAARFDGSLAPLH